MSKAARVPTRTMNVSPRAAEMVAELAKAAGETIREYVDRVWVPEMQAPFEKALRARLKKTKAGDDGRKAA